MLTRKLFTISVFVLLASSAALAQSSADLGVTMTPSPASTHMCDNVDYTLTVTNYGPNDAVDVALAFESITAARSDLKSLHASQGSCSLGSFILIDATCSLGDLPAGSTATVTARVNVGPSNATGQLWTIATVDSATDDLDGDDNRVELAIPITGSSHCGGSGGGGGRGGSPCFIGAMLH